MPSLISALRKRMFATNEAAERPSASPPNNPVYPGTDLARIEIVADAVQDWLDQIRGLDPLEHPESRWHPDDLRASLTGTLKDLAAERARVSFPLVLS